jgi:hypothetical protein
VPLAVHLSKDVTRFDQVTPQAVLAAGQVLGVPEKLAVRTIREVVTRVLGAFDALYSEQDPQQEGLLAQLPPQEKAQQLAVLRVLRYIVLPEMAARLLP